MVEKIDVADEIAGDFVQIDILNVKLHGRFLCFADSGGLGVGWICREALLMFLLVSLFFADAAKRECRLKGS